MKNKDDLTEDIREAAAAFLSAFDNLEWERFSSFIAQDATVFMPWPNIPKRLNGKAEIESVFRPFFESMLPEKVEPPYLNLNPLDLEAKSIGNVGFVTFHLLEDDHFGRRTLIFEKKQGAWQLVHLHASNFYK